MNSFTFTFGLHCVTKSAHPKLLSLRVPCDCFWAAFGVHFGCFLGVQRLPKTLWKACLFFCAFWIVFGVIWGTFFGSGLVCRAKTFASGAVLSLVRSLGGSQWVLEVGFARILIAFRNDFRRVMTALWHHS